MTRTTQGYQVRQGISGNVIAVERSIRLDVMYGNNPWLVLRFVLSAYLTGVVISVQRGPLLNTPIWPTAKNRAAAIVDIVCAAYRIATGFPLTFLGAIVTCSLGDKEASNSVRLAAISARLSDYRSGFTQSLIFALARAIARCTASPCLERLPADFTGASFALGWRGVFGVLIGALTRTVSGGVTLFTALEHIAADTLNRLIARFKEACHRAMFFIRMLLIGELFAAHGANSGHRHIAPRNAISCVGVGRRHEYRHFGLQSLADKLIVPHIKATSHKTEFA